SLLRLGRGLDVPLQQGPVQGAGDFLGQQGLAGAGLALDQQRALQRQGGVDGCLQGFGGDVAVGAVETAVWNRGGGLVHGRGSVAPWRPVSRCNGLVIYMSDSIRSIIVQSTCLIGPAGGWPMPTQNESERQ